MCYYKFFSDKSRITTERPQMELGDNLANASGESHTQEQYIVFNYQELTEKYTGPAMDIIIILIYCIYLLQEQSSF